MKRLIKAFIALIALGSISTLVIRETLDQRNANYIQQMGTNQEAFQAFIDEIHHTTPYVVFVTSGYRSTEKQALLHEQNAKNAKPGRSPHEFRRALDINLIGPTGWIRKSDTVQTWKNTGVPDIAKKHGFRWGGNFRTYHDPVHFDLPNPG